MTLENDQFYYFSLQNSIQWNIEEKNSILGFQNTS